jgi:2-polyprenyl-3-methyl-5-hydroxy-6-metoxy-1,4-benzoquinol methylase
MNALQLARRAGRRLLRLARGQGSGAIAQVFFDAEDIPRLVETWQRTQGAPGSDWEPYRHAHMRLPEWFQHGLNPWSADYRAQQHRLWQLITGIDRPYVPELHEREFGWEGVDPVRRPSFYMRRDALAVASASDHFFATSMLLKHCGLKPGDRALEYGAGFGQTALALARLGVHVDTVDISATFCEFIRQQADFFQVPLTPHHGPFGFNPRPGEGYHLIWFYESFHHCEDFFSVVPRLKTMLAPGGRLILGGEPIVDNPNAAVPYPWGIRLHSEVAVVMRKYGWFELGFTREFINILLKKNGIEVIEIKSDETIFADLFICHMVEND